MFLTFFILAVANLFLPPLPLESATLFGGYLSGVGHASLIVLILATSLGMSTGSMILFFLVRHYGEKLTSKAPFRKIMAGKSYQKTAQWFSHFGIWSIFLGKWIPGMNIATLILSATLGWDTIKAGIAIIGSNVIFYSILAVSGRVIGTNWPQAVSWLKRLNKYFLLLMLLLIIGTIIYIYYQRSKIPQKSKP